MTTTVSLTVNGKASRVDIEDRTLLVDVLRDHLGLTGTHVGCDTSQCGCCTVLLDGNSVKSCSLLAVQAQGKRITTIEGVAGDGESLHPVQVAFSQCHGLQCGYCTPGMIIASIDLLSRCENPDSDQIAEGLSGNLCRCTGYVNIESSVRLAATLMRETQGAQAQDTPTLGVQNPERGNR